MEKFQANAVIAGVFPAQIHSDGAWRVVGRSKVSTRVMSAVLTQVLVVGSVIELASGRRLTVDFPVTPINECVFARILRRMGATR